MIRTAAFSAFAATGLLVSGILVGTLAYHPATSHASTDSVPTTALGATSLAAGTGQAQTDAPAVSPAAGRRNGGPGPSGGWRWGGPGRFGGFGGPALTVSSVSNNTITATGRGGQTITITVTGATTYAEAGVAAHLSDVVKGERIVVRGTRSGASITATSITIVLPVEAGVVSNVSGSSFTLTGFHGAAHTIHTGAGTRYQKAGATATANDVTNGAAVVVEGTLNSDGSVNAVRITIQMQQVAGQVTAVTSNGYTLTSRRGATVTVITSGATTYSALNGATAAASAITKNSFILAQGALSADGKTLTALHIVILPANGLGRGGPGLFGRGGHGGGTGILPLATPTPASGI
jgi:hypothetical protein